MSTVCAIVVTHDRRELLRECLAALAAQSRPPDRVLVVDNASTDGTRDMLEREHPGVDVLALVVNEGGAGGFHEGMKRAHADGAEWLWLMDDDTIPDPDALAELLAARDLLDAPPTLLASKVVWRDACIHPMNRPNAQRRDLERIIDGAELGLVTLRYVTFVSLLVHRGAVDRHGLPLKHFFIWSDDIEWTGRVLAAEPGYLVPTSVALHDTATDHTAVTSPPDRFYFHVRNTVYILLGPGRGPREKLYFAWVLADTVFRYLRGRPRRQRAAAIGRGIRDGLRQPPPRSAATRTAPSRDARERRFPAA